MLPKGLLKEYSRAIELMLRGLDMLTVFFSGWLAYVVRFRMGALPSAYMAALFISLFITSLVFSSMHIYQSVRGENFAKHIMKLVQAVCIIGLMMAGLSFFTKSGLTFSRIWFILWMLLTLILIVLFRYSVLLLLGFMRSQGLNERRVVIVGVGDLGLKIVTVVQQALWTGFRIVALFDDDEHHKAAMHGIPIMRTPTDLGQYLTEKNIDEIWLALPLQAEKRVKEILYALRHHTINTRFFLDIFGMDLLHHSMTDVAGFPVLNIRSTPMMGVNRFIKAIEDRILAALILILVSPLLIVIAMGVKWSSKGPVFFKQHRLGWDGRIIKVYKFRTMLEHSETNGQVTQATANDHRVTRFGKFLRRSSFDELPQFINVLQGRMSIVGPRPHALAHNEFYKDAVHTYMQRHRVKPGITGWAQINGWRGETDTLDKMQKRVEYDLYYINNWSLGFDLKIILLTFFRGFINTNA